MGNSKRATMKGDSDKGQQRRAIVATLEADSRHKQSHNMFKRMNAFMFVFALHGPVM
jgi:hypothetical protein